MKIGIDISPIVYGTGVSNYTKFLVETLLKLDTKNEYKLFGGSLRRLGEFKKHIPSALNVELKTLPIPPTLAHLIWNKLHIFPFEKIVGDIDIFHSSDWTQPPSHAYKITTVHDLVPLRFPSLTHPKIVEAHKARLKWVAKEVDKIIAVSTFTKQEIVDLLNIDPDKIVVIPEAANPKIPKITSQSIVDTLKKYQIDKNFILAVGTNQRKNTTNIYNAFKKLKKEEDKMLVIVGQKTSTFKDSMEVKFTGHIANDELYNLYASADLLAYPSLYEGFGLPILEAMQMGCPVITSNIGSMPEVAGDAAVLVNPENTEDIFNGFVKILTLRKIWVEKGLSRAKEFSWNYTAKLTLREYEKGIK